MPNVLPLLVPPATDTSSANSPGIQTGKIQPLSGGAGGSALSDLPFQDSTANLGFAQILNQVNQADSNDLESIVDTKGLELADTQGLPLSDERVVTIEFKRSNFDSMPTSDADPSPSVTKGSLSEMANLINEQQGCETLGHCVFYDAIPAVVDAPVEQVEAPPLDRSGMSGANGGNAVQVAAAKLGEAVGEAGLASGLVDEAASGHAVNTGVGVKSLTRTGATPIHDPLAKPESHQVASRENVTRSSQAGPNIATPEPGQSLGDLDLQLVQQIEINQSLKEGVGVHPGNEASAFAGAGDLTESEERLSREPRRRVGNLDANATPLESMSDVLFGTETGQLPGQETNNGPIPRGSIEGVLPAVEQRTDSPTDYPAAPQQYEPGHSSNQSATSGFMPAEMDVRFEELVAGAEHVETNGPVEQIVETVLEAADGELVTEQQTSREICLRLQPAELGALEIRVESTEDTLTAHIYASELATSELLNRDKQLLTDALVDAGVATDEVEIEYRQSNEQGSNNSEGREGPHDEQGTRLRGRRETDQQVTETASQEYKTEGRLDVVV